MRDKDELFNILTGRTRSHIIFEDALSQYCHTDVVDDFLNLKNKAKDKGIDLEIVSAFRPFKRQFEIFTKKARGEISLLSDSEQTLNIDELTDEEILQHILRYSAIPGASRHHWGTDFDVFDKNALPSHDYKISLTLKESKEIFSHLTSFLKEEFSKNDSCFFCPFDGKKTLLSKEPWHISHREKSKEFEELYTQDIFIQNLKQIDLEETLSFKELLLKNPKYYFKNYFFK